MSDSLFLYLSLYLYVSICLSVYLNINLSRFLSLLMKIYLHTYSRLQYTHQCYVRSIICKARNTPMNSRSFPFSPFETFGVFCASRGSVLILRIGECHSWRGRQWCCDTVLWRRQFILIFGRTKEIYICFIACTFRVFILFFTNNYKTFFTCKFLFV